MSGSPPQHDLFDYKPKLIEINGQPCPDSFLKGERFAFIKGHPKCLGTPHKFAQHGQSGTWISDLLPNIARHADDIAVVKSMWTDQFNHAPAELLLHTGNPIAGKASMGSWVTYGLGSREPEPARLRRARLRRHRPDRRQEPLVQRLPAQRLPGRAVPQQRRADPVRDRPEGHEPRHAPPQPRRARSSSTRSSCKPSATPRRSRASTSTSSPTACRWRCPR